MKVLDLHCSQHHVFEGWFASEEAFQDQLQHGLVECPLCGDTQVVKMLTAPRLNLGGARPEASEARELGAAPRQDVMATPDAAMQGAWLKMVRHVMANTEDVGPRFADEARNIHYGESEQRGIRGQATRQETESLIEEGIGVLPLPLPKAFKEPLQ